MKRLWIGMALLLVLLGLGIGATCFSQKTNDRIAGTLSQAAPAAREGEWDTAAPLAEEARQQWEQYRGITAVIADHEPMEEIDSLFSQLEVWLQARDSVAFCACCASLEVLIRAVGEAQAVNWWSLL